MLKQARKELKFVLVFLILCAVLPAFTGFGVSKIVQRRLGIKVSGNFVPSLFLPDFSIKNASFDWKGKVSLVSGDLKVSYQPFSLLPGSLLRVKISGKRFKVKLLGAWSKMQGVENATLDDFLADLELDRKGIREIHKLHAQSPAFQFHIEKSE